MLIPVKQLIDQYGIRITGVLHLGAHQAEEAADYRDAGAEKVIWIEGNPELMPVLNEELKKFAGQVAYNVLVSDKDGDEVEFKVANNFQSSSILDLGTHKEHHPGITVHHVLKLQTHRLDNYFRQHNVDLTGCNFLNIDLQGAELLALRGLGDVLNGVDYIYTEINVGEVYVGCATLFQLDKFLAEKGFHRVDLRLTQWQWGDAFYVKKNVSAISALSNQWAALYYQFVYNISSSARKLYHRLRWLPGKVYRRLRPQPIVTVDPSENGENIFAGKIISACKGKPVIFDVGANRGEYAAMIAGQMNANGIEDFEIHLFEPQPACIEELRTRFAGDERFIINPFGLSEHEGMAEIHFDFSGSSSASLFERKEIQLDQKCMISLKPLQQYVSEKGINMVHLLKIDTEGNEKLVLLGAGDKLLPSIIRSVQFEYGGTYLDAKVTLAEVVQLLMNRGFKVGKLKPDSIEFKDHLGDFTEDYTYANYVAVDKNFLIDK
jgi:FkbM family methyltransferase